MAQSYHPSLATSARMTLAFLALSPFVSTLSKSIAPTAILCGCFTALGYASQSVALATTAGSNVAFLGAFTVVWCPTLEAIVDKKPSSVIDRPQTYLAGLLCLSGIGVLELLGTEMTFDFTGELFSILQAIGFGETNETGDGDGDGDGDATRHTNFYTSDSS